MNELALPHGELRELALFAGAGGGLLGGHILGWRTVCAVELDPYCRRVLLARQRDGMLPRFPVWDDIRTFDGRPWRGHVDVVSGGFPCQDISCAGRGDGLDGSRSGLWFQMARVIGEVAPAYVFVENSPMLIVRGLDRVLGTLADLGYDARWGVVSAADTGAPHLRKRVWIVAHAQLGSHRSQEQCREADGPQANRSTSGIGRSGNGSRAQDVGYAEGQRGDGAGDTRARGARSENASGPLADPEGGEPREQAERTRGAGAGGGGADRGGTPRAGQTSTDAGRVRQQRQGTRRNASDKTESREGEATELVDGGLGAQWESEPDVGRVAHGVADGLVSTLSTPARLYVVMGHLNNRSDK